MCTLAENPRKMAARDDEFLLTVRGPDNRPLHVSVTPQTKVSEVKRKLRQKSQYIDQMDIVFNGDFLQDEKRLKVGGELEALKRYQKRFSN